MGKHKEKSKKHKRDKKKHKGKRKHRKSSSSSASSDDWVEKEKYSSSEDENKFSEQKQNVVESESSKRDEWMSLSTSFSSESHLDRRKIKEEKKRLDKERSQYNPREHVRELNPYWKDGGDGLPKFRKPTDKDDSEEKYKSVNKYNHSSSWRKKAPESSRDTTESSLSSEPGENQKEVLSDKELNVLASKLLKAEIMGKTELVKELKQKLENARKQKESNVVQKEDIILTHTDSKGDTRPIRLNNYAEPSCSQKKKRKIETHQDGQRVRYFPDDDKYSLQQMFENEKYNSVNDQNSEFMKMASRVRKNDDLEDIFADNIRRKQSDKKSDQKQRDKSINEQQRVIRSIDSCKLCIQSNVFTKHLMVSLGETAFLSLPSFEPLTQGHCIISPIRHVTCSTLLDENEWSDVMNFRRALTRMFNAKNEDVIFFEVAKNLERYPHMQIECVPLDKEEGDSAPIYFKKAIDECEAEWAQNKKLVSLKGRDVRRAVPKGLPYFFVSFGMEEGYAHVIEDERSFPHNFAQEIIGGMLDLHHSKWRKPKQQSFEEQSRRVLEFSKEWSDFDCTKT